MPIDFEQIWNVLTGRFRLGSNSLHGPEHWKRVEANAIELAQTYDVDLIVVRLFAVFHDCEREDESTDPEHGLRAGSLALHLHGDLYEIEQRQLDDLLTACRYHNDGTTTTNLTVGICWDADRLDLPRVGIVPDADYMSTEEGKRRAEAMGARHGQW